MTKHMHLGLSIILSVAVLNAADSVIQPEVQSATTRDAKTNHILQSISHIVQGLIKIIKDPHNKPNVLTHVGEMLSGVFTIAATSLHNHELNEEEAAELRTILEEVVKLGAPLLQNKFDTSLPQIRKYLKEMTTDDLALLQCRSDDQHAMNQALTDTDSNDPAKELHLHIVNAFQHLVQNLFAIIQAPENPKIIGQNIADMLSSIINVASHTLRYEYLSSTNAEENVALYLESFSNELTKEIKRLMIQSALHLRACCSSCGTCSSCGSTNCNGGCCRIVPDATQEQISATNRACCSSCGACSSCGSTSCNGGCCRVAPAEAQEQISATNRACCSSCGACSSCGSTSCNGSCCRVAAQDDSPSKCPCNKPQQPPVVRDTTSQEQLSTTNRACCSSCGACSSCGSTSCNGSCCKSTTLDNDSSKCGCNKPQQPPARHKRALRIRGGRR